MTEEPFPMEPPRRRWGLSAIHFAARRKQPPLVDEHGNALPTRGLPPILNWCRISVVVALIESPEGKIVTYSLTRRTLRATIHATRKTVAAALIVVAGCVPWIRDLVVFAVKHWLLPG